jgi:hypothetical protein
MTRERIVTGILQPYAKKPGAALSILKMLRVLIRHAIEIGWLKHDPSFGIKRPKTNEVRSWTDAEITTFELIGRLAQSSGLDSRSCSTLANVGATCTA